MKLDVQSQGGRKILDVDRQGWEGGAGGLENRTIFMDVIVRFRKLIFEMSSAIKKVL